MSGTSKPAHKIKGLTPWQISLLSIVSGLFVWQMVSDFIIANPLFLASPLQVVKALFGLMASGELWKHIYTSGIEFLSGYAIAAVLGISIGLLIATNEFAKHWLQPWISGFYATPTVATVGVA